MGFMRSKVQTWSCDAEEKFTFGASLRGIGMCSIESRLFPGLRQATADPNTVMAGPHVIKQTFINQTMISISILI